MPSIVNTRTYLLWYHSICKKWKDTVTLDIATVNTCTCAYAYFKFKSIQHQQQKHPSTVINTLHCNQHTAQSLWVHLPHTAL
mmetsp:Transcript_12965/g.21920  ORF Transcript_12965/g.21920 Transcript_12965/m.21920 type:complete len:82 (-) Transcript_12965:162-407(-)